MNTGAVVMTATWIAIVTQQKLCMTKMMIALGAVQEMVVVTRAGVNMITVIRAITNSHRHHQSESRFTRFEKGKAKRENPHHQHLGIEVKKKRENKRRRNHSKRGNV